jgi:hypothetical protein
MAQQAWSRTSTDTLSNADTVVIVTDAIPDAQSVKIQATVARQAGTLAGKVYLQETINGIDYVSIDSLTLTNVSRSTKIFSITAPPGTRYQLQYITSGSVTAVASAYMIRRRL